MALHVGNGRRRKRLRRKEYRAAYDVKERVNPKTGKQERVTVYKGDYYTLSTQHGKRIAYSLLAAWLLCVALFVAAGLVNAQGSRTFYVLPVYMVLCFPLFYAGMAAVRLVRMPTPFTEVDKQDGVDRLKHSLMGIWVLAALHTLLDIVLMLTGGAGEKLNREILYAALSALMGVCAFLAWRAVPGAIKQGEKPPQTEAVASTPISAAGTEDECPKR